MRAIIKPMQYRTKRYDTFFFNHSESAVPIPKNVAVMAVTTVKKIPSAINLLFLSQIILLSVKRFFNHIVFAEDYALGFFNHYIGHNTDSNKFRAVGKFFVPCAYTTVISPA